MATVNKDFKVKNGLIVEGATATVNGYDVLTKDQDDQNYIIGLVGGSANTEAVANSIVLRDANASFSANVITADLVGDVTGTVSDISNHDTDDLSEGTSNLYFSNARAKDAAADLLTSASLTNITITGSGSGLTITAENGVADSNTDDLAEGATNLYYTNARAQAAFTAGNGLSYDGLGQFSASLGNGLEFGITGEIQIDDNVVATDSDVSTAVGNHSNAITGVHGVSGDVVGTSDSQTLSNKVLGNAVSLGASLDANSYTITNLAEPSQASDAATKGYVDAVAEGLHIHASVAAATTANITLAPAPATIDGVTLTTNMRVLVKDQNATAENGIYVFDGTDLVRADDYDTAAEIQAGDFVFVSGGTLYNSTGWVQENPVTTLGTDPIAWDQFSGAGEYTAGTGLNLNGTEFSVDTTVIATQSYVGNAIADHADDISGVHGVTGNVVGTSDTQTLSNKFLGTGIVLSANLDAVNTHTVSNLAEPTSAQDAATKNYVDGEISSLSNTVSGLTTDDISEGSTNLYFSNARAEAAVSNLDTDDLSEGSSNLYFTDFRAETVVQNMLTSATQENISITYIPNVGLSIVAENGVADSDTDDLVEGTTNLYFTNARAVAALEAITPNFTEIDINSVATQVAATTGNVATASQVTAYSWPKANFRSAEFLVKVAYSTHTEVSKVILTMDTSDNIAITEYAIVGTNGSASTITADVSGSDARLRVTTINNNSTVTIVGTLLA